MKLNRRTKVLIATALGVVLVFVMERVFFSSLRAKMKNLHQQIKAQEAELKTDIAVQKRKELIQLNYEKNQVYFSMMSLSDRDIVAGFLKEIEGLAQASGVSIVRLSPQNESGQPAHHKEYSADLRIEGQAEQIFDFLFRLQSSPFLIQLAQLTIAPKDKDASFLKMEMMITLNVP